MQPVATRRLRSSRLLAHPRPVRSQHRRGDDSPVAVHHVRALSSPPAVPQNHFHRHPPVIDLQSDQFFMTEALRQAQRAYLAGEVPVGAVVVSGGRVIARAFNQVETLKDATAHAEMLALTQAESALGDWRLTECDLYVTKEPCPMCAGAIVHCRVRRVVFGCDDKKGGAAGGGFINLLQQETLNHQSTVTAGVLAEESRQLLKTFFVEARTKSRTSGSN
ncbi:MAG: tRNA adenosine(34) deaminase TadA [Verrucomicrobiae bacterium]|nr:tRNA adenosine(34) deaminase TadA [Verrucomicrobiae bacterium]